MEIFYKIQFVESVLFKYIYLVNTGIDPNSFILM